MAKKKKEGLRKIRVKKNRAIAGLGGPGEEVELKAADAGMIVSSGYAVYIDEGDNLPPISGELKATQDGASVNEGESQ